jgi:hypothetical protein
MITTMSKTTPPGIARLAPSISPPSAPFFPADHSDRSAAKETVRGVACQSNRDATSYPIKLRGADLRGTSGALDSRALGGQPTP